LACSNFWRDHQLTETRWLASLARILRDDAFSTEKLLAGCGKTSFFSEIRNSYNAESKADYS